MNREILDLWRNTESEIRGPYLPILYPENQPRPDILFVGINPSLNKNYIPLLSTDPNTATKEIEASVIEEYEKAVQTYSRYFGRYRTLASRLQKSWAHRDLFFFRNTFQDEVRHHVMERVGRRKVLNIFGKSQIKLFCKIVQSLNPRIIFVANKGASDYLKKNQSRETGYSINGVNGLETYQSDGFCCPIIFDRAFQSGAPALWYDEAVRKIFYRVGPHFRM